MQMNNRIFISIGSNINPELYLPRAVENLANLAPIDDVSRVFQTPAVSSDPQPDYLNAAVLINTRMTLNALLQALRQIENNLKRERGPDKFAPRTIDLDICLFDNKIIAHEKIRIPSPDLLKFAHVAIPVADLMPNFKHPETGETLESIAARLEPELGFLIRTDVDIDFID